MKKNKYQVTVVNEALIDVVVSAFNKEEANEKAVQMAQARMNRCKSLQWGDPDIYVHAEKI